MSAPPKPFVCIQCHQSFFGKDARTGNPTSRYPLILTCGHTACLMCLKTASKNHKFFCCTACLKETPLPEGETSVRKLLADLCVLGVLSLTSRTFSTAGGRDQNRLKVAASTSAGRKDSVQFEQTGVTSTVSCEECSLPAKWWCQTCQVHFCGKCFDKIHSVSKIFKKHRGFPVHAQIYRSMVQKSCTIHGQSPVDFFCEDDSTLVCNICAVQGEHRGHNCLSIMEKNEACLPELKLAIEEARVARARMRDTLKKLEERKLCAVVDVIPKEQEIRENFHQLHAALQLREAELINQLHDYGQRNRTQVEAIAEDLSSSIKEVTAHLYDAKMLQKCTFTAVNAVSLIKELKSAKKLPCFLVEENRPKTEITVHLSQTLLQHIKQACSIDAEIHSGIKVLPESELPDMYTIEPVSDEALTDTESSPSVNGSATDVILTPSESSENAQPTKFKFIKPKQSKILRHEYVKVVHIQSPSSFYVQYCNNASRFNSMMDNIQKFARSFDGAEDIPTSVFEGLVYLVKYRDNKWYRAKVNKVFSASTLDLTTEDISDDEHSSGLLMDSQFSRKCELLEKQGQGDKIPGTVKVTDVQLPSKTPESNDLEQAMSVTSDQLLHVTYMDFGNSDIVAVDRIRNIPSKFMTHPFFAHECALWDILPVELSTEWSKEAITSFLRFVDNQKLLLSVVEENNGILYADLYQPAHMDVSNDSPVSAREVLVFMEFAQYDNIGASRKAEGQLNFNRYFLPDPILMGERVNVMVTHIENPADFYVMLQGGISSYFVAMYEDLQKHCTEPKEDMQKCSSMHRQQDLLNIFVTRQGQPCVALYPEDSLWYRAQVVENFGSSLVKVKFVDYGNTSVVPLCNLRKIVDSFMKYPIQGIHCVLADIAPSHKNWDEECIEWLKEKTKGKRLEMVVHKRSAGNKHVVSLFAIGEECDFCINALLVVNGFARSTGPGSSLVEVPRLEVSRSENENEKEDLAKTNPFTPKPLPTISQVGAVPPRKQTSHENDRSGPLATRKTKLQVLREASSVPAFPLPQADSNAHDTAQSIKSKKSAKKLHVKIVHFDSPASFYTQKVDDLPQLKKLMTDLLNYYEREEHKMPDLEKGTFVAVLNPIDHNYFRARIEEVCNEKKTVKVIYLDFGWDMEVPIDNVKLLTKEFHRFLAYATKCHLVGLIPAGGSTWTRSACEFARDLVYTHSDQYLVVKKKDPESTEIRTSVPVDILLKEVVIGGALEPNRTIYHSLTEKLLDNGYALSEEKLNMQRNRKCETDVQYSKEQPDSDLEVVPDSSESQGVESTVLDSSESQGVKSTVLDSSESTQNDLDENDVRESGLVSCSDLEVDWVPCRLPESASFMAYPSYIGYDGCIYLHEKENAHDTLEHISSSLCNIFNKDRYQKPKQVVKVGQTCVARFEVDKKWYRGKVHKVIGECVEVIFVDYGNLELVRLEDIRLFATYLDIPLQCYECELHNVKPISDNGQWPTPTLDFIHKTIVEKLVLVIIKEPPVPGRRVKVNIVLTGGDTLRDILVKEQLAHIAQPNLMLLSGAIENPYKCLPNPSLGSTFCVQVTHVIDPGLVCLQRLRNELASDPLETIVNNELDSFLDMINRMFQIAPTQPLLRKLTVGEACLGQYSFDGNWYRCIIADCDEEKATVVFIDYGNSETIPLNSKKLRKMPEELMSVSTQALTCRLHGIVSPEGEWSMTAHQAMSDVLFKQSSDRNVGEFVAQVMEIGVPIEIVLTEQETSSRPVYQDLINRNIVAMKV